jgi:hypothetical protein
VQWLLDNDWPQKIPLRRQNSSWMWIARSQMRLWQEKIPHESKSYVTHWELIVVVNCDGILNLGTNYGCRGKREVNWLREHLEVYWQCLLIWRLREWNISWIMPIFLMQPTGSRLTMVPFTQMEKVEMLADI